MDIINSMKVFVLVNEWAYDYEQDMTVEVYESEKDAVAKMKEEYEDFVRREYDEDGTFNSKSFDEENLTAEVHEEGDWTCNHCAWDIYERDTIW